MAIAVPSLALGGCDDAADDTPQVEVPEVREFVESAELCQLAAEIRCAGAMECCPSGEVFASTDECLASSSCQDTLDALVGSEMYADGTLVYDAEAAAAALKATAETTASCAVEAPQADLANVFVGTLGEGDDCTPRDDSEAHWLACAAGLQCVVDFDEATGIETGSCQRLDFTPSDEDAPIDQAFSAEELYCEAPTKLTPPSNPWVPVGLSVNVPWPHSNPNGGTSADITLRYIGDGRTTEYYCTIYGGIEPGETKICSNMQTRTWSNPPSNDLFYVEMDSNDGLLVDSVAVCSSLDNSGTQCGSTYVTGGTFDNGDTSMLVNSTYVWEEADTMYKWFWVDGNGHGNCIKAKIKLDDDNRTNCSVHS